MFISVYRCVNYVYLCVMAKGVMAGFNNIWNSKQISYRTKLNILKTCVFSTALYACETWTIKKTDRNKILAFEMYCYRRMLHLRWTQSDKCRSKKEAEHRQRSVTSSYEKETESIWTHMSD